MELLSGRYELMKIAYITMFSPHDKYFWSGTNYYVKNALEAQNSEVHCIYGYRKVTLGMMLRKFQARLTGKIIRPYALLMQPEDGRDSYLPIWKRVRMRCFH